jgi:hypothetical protein
MEMNTDALDYRSTAVDRYFAGNDFSLSIRDTVSYINIYVITCTCITRTINLKLIQNLELPRGNRPADLVPDRSRSIGGKFSKFTSQHTQSE